jgi:(p)ppGpp synthase/HD superfamily hydrolase
MSTENLKSSTNIIRAAVFADKAHKGQFRKWTGEPYIYHPQRIAGRLMREGKQESLVVAGWLHDVIEDCNISFCNISTHFGNEVGMLIWFLTNPSKKHPELKRTERKFMDFEHLKNANKDAQIIKAIDRIDNLGDIKQAPVDFQKIYLKETQQLIEKLDKIPISLKEELKSMLL